MTGTDRASNLSDVNMAAKILIDSCVADILATEHSTMTGRARTKQRAAAFKAETSSYGMAQPLKDRNLHSRLNRGGFLARPLKSRSFHAGFPFPVFSS